MSFSRERNLLSAQDLVALIGVAGPGAKLPVRIHSKNGDEARGRTSWGNDRTAGGPVVIFQNPQNVEEDWLIPLGGQIVYDSPPRIKAGDSGRSGFPFGKTRVQKVPINPIAETYKFELLGE